MRFSQQHIYCVIAEMSTWETMSHTYCKTVPKETRMFTRPFKNTLGNGRNMLNGNYLKVFFYEQLINKFSNTAFWKSTRRSFLTSTFPSLSHAVPVPNWFDPTRPPVHGPPHLFPAPYPWGVTPGERPASPSSGVFSLLVRASRAGISFQLIGVHQVPRKVSGLVLICPQMCISRAGRMPAD